MNPLDFSPSVDELGRITYSPHQKTYRPIGINDCEGKKVRIITDLNHSQTFTITENERRKKLLKTRVYSLSDNRGLLGHSFRLVLSNVTGVYKDKLHEKVLRDNSKTPHAFLRGDVSEILDPSNYERHHQICEEFADAQFIAYDPYKTNRFRFCENRFLPSKETTEELDILDNDRPAKKIYCFENGILAMR